MTGIGDGFRAIAVGLLASGTFACSTADRSPKHQQPVAEARQALDPWTPRSLGTNLVAWYVAASGPGYLTRAADNTVSQWFDQSGNGNHVAQQTTQNEPHYNATGWAGTDPTLTFDGADLLRLDTWSAVPAGTEGAFAVLAVVRPSATVDSEVAGWWDPNGVGAAWAGFKVADGRLVGDMGRLFGLSYGQSYSGPHDLSPHDAAVGRHAIVWRYLPASHAFTLTVDGATAPPSSNIPPLDTLPQMPFIVGAGNLLPTRLFQGDISELIVASTLTDNDVQNFTDYARARWHGLPTQGNTDPCVDSAGQWTSSTTRCDDHIPSTYGDHCSNGACTGTVPPPGSPAELNASAWYHAGAPEVAIRDGGAEIWFDRTLNHVDISNGFYFGRPLLSPDGWSTGKPTLTFTGHHILFRNAWSGAPAGTEAEYTVLAVLQPTASQSAGVAAWWPTAGAGRIASDLKATGGSTILDLFRMDVNNGMQDFPGTADVGTAKRVAAWRYSAGRAQVSLNGVNLLSSTLSGLGPISPDTIMLGSDSAFANVLLKAELAELAVVPRSLSDTELARFVSYAQTEWGGLGGVCTPSCTGKSCGASDDCGGVCDCGLCSCAPGFACDGGAALNTDDNNPCTADSCNPSVGVVHAPLLAGTNCSDGNACNGMEACNGSGVCVGGTPVTIDDNNPCTSDSCNSSTGVVTHAPSAVGTSCSDGNACNGAETCNGSGSCAAGTPPNTNDNNPCTADGCSPATGVTHSPLAAGSSCSDGNVCNGGETCNSAGTCQAGIPPLLDDQDPCTADSCDPAVGVTHSLVAAGSSCSDGNACNGEETCNALGECVYHDAPSLDDGNPCTVDTCSQSAGIQHTPKAGSACPDQDKCNGDETCDANGQCLPGVPPVVDDGNPCTVDSCLPALGVQHVAAPAGSSCSDGIACNGSETCGAGATCGAGTPVEQCTTNGCQNTALRVIDIHSDFRDIWAGREELTTGKRASWTPAVTVTFNTPVDPALLSASFVGQVGGSSDAPEDCLASPGNVPDRVSASDLTASADEWAVSLIPTLPAERAPLDFNLVAFDTVSGLVSSEGPVAIGGNASLAGFQVNHAGQAPIGLLVEGALTGSSGTVGGDLVWTNPARPPILDTVTVGGQQRRARPLRFERLYRGLTKLSDELSRHVPNGQVEVQGANLSLVGLDSRLNIFDVTPEVLANANMVSFNIPLGASALVNVRGTTVAISANVSLGSGDPGHVLWNFPDALRLSIGGGSFSGSVLAADAVVATGSGDRFGTLVVGAAIGAGILHSRPLTSWATFAGSGRTTSVTFRANSQLKAACQYRFRLEAFPASAGGGCLASPFEVAFLVAPNDQPSFDRELVWRTMDLTSTSALAFRAATGINTLVNEVFDRYSGALGLRKGIDALVRSPRAGRSPTSASRQTAFFQQTYKGIPVDGSGYLVEHENELFRGATGHLLPNLSLDVVPSIDAATAIEAALAAAAPSRLPWTETPPSAAPPSPELVVLRAPAGVQPIGPRLAWRVHLFGIAQASSADIDAQDGSVLHVQSKREKLLPPVACTGIDEDRARYTGAVRTDVIVPLGNGVTENRSDLRIGLYDQDDTLYHAYSIARPFRYRTSWIDLTGDFPVATDYSQAPTIDYACVSDDPTAEKIAAAQWSTQATAEAFSHLKFNEKPWVGITGADDAQLIVQLEHTQLVPGCDPNTDDCRSEVVAVNHLDTSYVAWDDMSSPNDPEQILLEEFDDDLPSVAHEFAHGVLQNSRAQVGQEHLADDSEAGSLREAFGDMMAAYAVLGFFAESESDSAWCIPLSSYYGVGCERDAVSPGDSSRGAKPDTYKIAPWCDYADDDCEEHHNATVATHWFYLLSEGQDGSVSNGIGCGISVTPVAIEVAAQIAFQAFSEISSDASFDEARATTVDVARDLYDEDVAASVEQAWLAVGVGDYPKPTTLVPGQGDTGVEPWPTTFQWDIANQAGPWVLRWATDPDFSDALEMEVPVTQVTGAAGHRLANWQVVLDPNTKYYWQAREGTSGGSADAWSKCASWVASFKTGEKKVTRIVEPKTKSGSFYQLSPVGYVGWEKLSGAGGYDILLSESENGCDFSASNVYEYYQVIGNSGVPHAYLGDGIEPNNQIRLFNPVLVEPSLTMDPDRTYHLYLRPWAFPSHYGTCAHFPVRKTWLRPFSQVSPLATPGGTIPTLEYAKGGPFVWTPSEGATGYRIAFMQLLGDGSLNLLKGESFDAVTLGVVGDHVEAQLTDDVTPTTIPGQVFWSVDAVKGEFARHGLQPEALLDAINRAEYFASAAEVPGLFGPSGACGRDTKGTLTETGFTECAQHFVNVDPNVPPSHEGVVCVDTGPNTVGALWWFGDTADSQHPDPAEVQDSVVYPNPANSTGYCVGPSSLDVTSEDMTLLVLPYSNAYSDGPHGYGPQHAFRITTDGDCGYDGGPCCGPYVEDPGLNFTGCSGDWLDCDATDHCAECGGTDQHSCPGHHCQTFDEARQEDATHFCRPCGSNRVTCCRSNQLDGLFCPDDGTYSKHIVLCDPENCEFCGRAGEPCCADDPNGPCPFEGADVSCQGANGGTTPPQPGTCMRTTPTPDPGDPPGTLSCGQTLGPQHGNSEGGTFDFNVYATSGTFLFKFNTWLAKDRIIVRQGDAVLLDTLCMGTLGLPPGPVLPLAGAGLYNCQGPDPGADGTPAGQCEIELPLFGIGPVVQVEVQALCDLSSGTDTDWEFTILCPQ